MAAVDVPLQTNHSDMIVCSNTPFPSYPIFPLRVLQQFMPASSDRNLGTHPGLFFPSDFFSRISGSTLASPAQRNGKRSPGLITLYLFNDPSIHLTHEWKQL